LSGVAVVALLACIFGPTAVQIAGMILLLAPDYMPEAGTPSEEAWAHERELYGEKKSADA
jgi:hypothetical protein